MMDNIFKLSGREDEELTQQERHYISLAHTWANEISKNGMVSEFTSQGEKMGFSLARIDVYDRIPRIRELIKETGTHRFGEAIYSPLIYASIFELQFGFINRFLSYQVLMLALFGNDIKPYLPSIYLASISHPELISSHFDKQEACQLLEEIDDYKWQAGV